MSRLLTTTLLSLSALFPVAAMPAEDTPPPPYTVVTDQATVPLLSPSLRERRTLKMRLANGLEAYLISDPGADKSSAALTVGVGSWTEPADKPGLAHFLEHMLFLGTKAYPTENDYDHYISLHGGSNNAFTTNDSTAYLFSIDHDALPGALDRFASFFKEPLFNPSGVTRELNAIDQEYSKNLLNDQIRQYHVLKAFADPNHPESRFHMGNSASLKGVVPDDLKAWYEKHYSASNMHLVVYSALPLEELQKLVVNDFKDVPEREATPFISSAPVTSPESSGKIVFIEPITNTRALSLYWELPQRFATDKNHPERVVCFILGHEGTTSLLAELKRENLATALSCGLYEHARDHKELMLQIELTEEGLKKYQVVIERVFQTIAGLRSTGIPEGFFNEIKQEDLLNYQYQGRRDAFEEAMIHALKIANEPLETYPQGQELLWQYDPRTLEAFVRYLTPEHCRYVLLAPANETRVVATDKDPSLGASYSIRAIPQPYFIRWKEAKPHPAITLPASNPFIAQDLSLLAKDAAETQGPVSNRGVPIPTVLANGDDMRVYYALDTLYRVPKLSVLFTLRTPAISPRHARSVALAEIYIKCVQEMLTNASYDAQLAGLEASFSISDRGIEMTIHGFNDKILRFFETITAALSRPYCDEERFYQFKDTLLRSYADYKLKAPIEQAVETFKNLVYQNYATAREKESALRRITLADYHTFVEGLYAENFIEGMIYGNISADDARLLVQQLQTALGGQPYPPGRQEEKKILLLSSNEGPFYYEETIPVAGNAIVLAIDGGEATYQQRAIQQIAMQVLREGFYNALRTQQQTAYIVTSSGEELEGQIINLLAEQSYSHDSRDLLARFEMYLEKYLHTLATKILPEPRFKNLRDTFINQLSQPPHDMEEMGQLLKQLAFTYHGDFERPTKRLEAFKNLSYTTFLEQTQAMLGRQNHRRLAVLLRGTFTEEIPFHYQRARSRAWLRQQGTFIQRGEK